jgi:hypothetical protein
MIFLDQLNELSESRTLVDVRRDDLNVDDLRGFILGTSAKLVLIGLVGDDIQPDGYTLIDLNDVTFLRWGTAQLMAWERAVRGMTGQDLLVDVDLSSWWSAIAAAQATSPLVTFHRERLAPTTCYISDQFRYSDSLIVGRHISIEGERDGSIAIRSDDLTRVDFGGRYESGLNRVLKVAEV